MTDDDTDETRLDAVRLTLAAFATAADERVNTPTEVTMTQGALALRTLGVSNSELTEAAISMGLTFPGSPV